ncbi:helix-turn-helix transcriptional regulator [Allorhizobium undicola]|uniref:helix-turn-helix transcriptional regulator n=1 Tax=Allorhizobium undicola TaxID=78527 RepID=UPI003D3306BE
MGNTPGYFDLLDWLEDTRPLNPDQFLKKITASYRLSGCLYIDACLKFPHGMPCPGKPATSRPLILRQFHHNLPAPLRMAAMALGADMLAQIFALCSHALDPVNLEELEEVRERWQPILHDGPVAFHGGHCAPRLLQECPALAGAEAIDRRQISLFRQALLDTHTDLQATCYPLLAHDGYSALFVVASSAAPEQWRQLRRIYDRDLYRLAGKFHALAAKTALDHRRSIALPRLTPREREALDWTAAGKSYWEIAVILGIRERTVRYFMANVRTKLDAVSNTQAVAKAISLGLISTRMT